MAVFQILVLLLIKSSIQWRIQELLVGGMMYPVSYYPHPFCLLPASPSQPLLSAARYMEVRCKPSCKMISYAYYYYSISYVRCNNLCNQMHSSKTLFYVMVGLQWWEFCLSVCLSVRPSVCPSVKGVHCDKTGEKSVHLSETGPAVGRRQISTVNSMVVVISHSSSRCCCCMLQS